MCLRVYAKLDEFGRVVYVRFVDEKIAIQAKHQLISLFLIQGFRMTVDKAQSVHKFRVTEVFVSSKVQN